MKTIKEFLEDTGTVEVRTAPLLMLIGAIMSSPNGPRLDEIVEMLDPDFNGE